MTEPIYRYRAVKPFEEEQSMLFFGRDEEIGQLSELIFSNKLTVLYGKSGYGKSSLLNAGILPRLKKENDKAQKMYLPVPVRFQTYEEGGESLMQKFRFHFGRAMEKQGIAAATNQIALPDTLWGLFKTVQPKENSVFVLLFDQFEEFFSYPIAQQNDFKEQLSELIYTSYPAFVRENRSQLDEPTLDFLSGELQIRSLFAIREDRLSELDALSRPLDAILKNRMKLGALAPAQAREAILCPAALDNENGRFKTEKFGYEKTALEKIENALLGSETRRIESFVLQIICFSIEKTVERLGLQEVRPENLPNFDEVFDTYYREQLAELDRKHRVAAADVLEKQLLFYDADTQAAHRRSVDALELAAPPDLLEALERTYLIRREVNSLGRHSFEISHDTLMEPILKQRKIKDAAAEEIRKENERQEAEHRAAEAEKRALAEADLRRTAERQRQRAKWFALGAGLAAAVALGVAVWAYTLKKQAEHLTQTTVEQNTEIQNTLLEIQRTQAAKQKLEFETLESRAAIILDAEGCPEAILQEMTGIADSHPDSMAFRASIRLLTQKSKNCQ